MLYIFFCQPKPTAALAGWGWGPKLFQLGPRSLKKVEANTDFRDVPLVFEDHNNIQAHKVILDLQVTPQ